MELSQFTYLQHVAGIECAPVSGELTYGLKRLAMYVQGLDNVYDLEEYSRYNFEAANTGVLLQHFKDAEAACRALLKRGAKASGH